MAHGVWWASLLIVVVGVLPALLLTPTGAVFTATNVNTGNTFRFGSYQEVVLADSPVLYLPLTDAGPSGSSATTAAATDASGNAHSYQYTAPGGCTLNGGGLLPLGCNGLLGGITQPPAVTFQSAGPPGIHPSATAAKVNFGGTCLFPPSTGTANNGISSAAAWNAQATPAITLEAWVNTGTTAGGPVIGYSPGSETAGTLPDRLLYLNSGGRPVLAVSTPNVTSVSGANVSLAGTLAAATTYLTGPTAVNNSAWHHLVATVQPNPAPPSAGATYPAVLTLWVDGVLAVTTTTTAASNDTSSPSKWRIQCFQVQPNTSTINVGSPVLGLLGATAAPYSLVGSLASVAIYYGSAASPNTVLSAATIQGHFAMGSHT
ncbi:hypothetical protein ABIB25_002934 [Nakamurella sp. UYEF19]